MGWLKKYTEGGPVSEDPPKTLLKNKKVAEIQTKVKDINLKDVVYNGPKRGSVVKKGCPDGVGCSEQSTDVASSLTGVNRDKMSPMHAGYRNEQFNRDEAEWVWKGIENGYSKTEDILNHLKNIPDSTKKNLQVGDFVGLTRNSNIGLDYPYDSDPVVKKYFKPSQKDATRHWGVVVGKDESGNPLIRHGWGTDANKGDWKVDPIDDIKIGKNVYKPTSVRRPKVFSEDGVMSIKDIVESGHDRATAKKNTSSDLGFYLGGTDEEKLIKDLPVAAEFSGANTRLKTKQNLVSFINDNKLDDELKYKLGITQAELNGYKPVAYGIAGQESNFNDVDNPLAAAKDVPGNLVNSSNSKGLFQIKYDSLTKEEREVLGIKSPKDLLDDKKAYKASILMLVNSKKRMDSEVEQGTHPELKDADPYFRAAYYYNSPARAVSTAKQWSQGNKPVTLDPTTWLNNLKTRERDGIFAEVDPSYQKNTELRMDEGSYPYKVMQKAKDLKQYVNSDPNNPVNLEEVKVYSTKGKKSKVVSTLKNGGTIPQGGWMDKYQEGGTIKAQKGKSFEDITRIKTFTSLNNYSSDATLMKQIKKDADAREVERRIHNAAKETVIGQGKKSTPYSEKLRVLKNKASIIGQPNVQIDEQGNTSRINQNRGYEGNAENFMSKREDKAGDHAIGALEAASIVMPAGQLVEKGLKAAGKYLTEQTALKNAWKLNPYAFKPNPEMMYRGIGKEGAEDALKSGVFRAKQNVKPIMDETYGRFQLNKQFSNTYYTPKFNVADQYGQGFIAEVPKDAAKFNLRYPGGKVKKIWSQSTSENIPISKGKILKKDWSKGYKEIPKNANGDVWWNGKGYQSTPTSSQEVLSSGSGMDALPKGYNIHLKNQSPYVPPTTDPKLMATQGRIDWNGVNYDNIKNWFDTRPTKTINVSNSNGIFNTGKPNSVVSNVSGNVSNTGIDIPNSLKNIEPSDYNFINIGENPIKGQGYAVDLEDYIGGLSNPEWRKDAGNTTWNWLKENRMRQGDGITNVMSNPTTQTSTLGNIRNKLFGSKSEINWGKWNSEIPSNKALMSEYSNIERTSKAKGTWMKNPDGSAFQGTPEQFVQQNSQNFKKAFPEGFDETYRGISNFYNTNKLNEPLFTGDISNASHYASTNSPGFWDPIKHKIGEGTKFGDVSTQSPEHLSLVREASKTGDWSKVRQYELNKVIESNSGGIHNYYVPKSNNKLVIDAKGKEWTNIPYEGREMPTDFVAEDLFHKNLDYIDINNVRDPRIGNIKIINPNRVNVKSTRGNNGMFDMTNPNIYKSLVPVVVGAGVLQQKKQGGWLNKY